MQQPTIITNMAFWEAFAARAAKEAERLEKETKELIARVEYSRRESEEEKARIQAAADKLSKGNGQIIAIDFKGRHFIG